MLLVSEAKFQSSLLYAMRAVSDYYNYWSLVHILNNAPVILTSDDNIRAFIQENIVENVNIYSQCFVYQIGFILTSTTSRDQN